MSSSGWCAAEGQPLWWQGAAVLSDKETLFLHSDSEEHPAACCSPLQRHCGFRLLIVEKRQEKFMEARFWISKHTAFKTATLWFLEGLVYSSFWGRLRYLKLFEGIYKYQKKGIWKIKLICKENAWNYISSFLQPNNKKHGSVYFLVYLPVIGTTCKCSMKGKIANVYSEFFHYLD